MAEFDLGLEDCISHCLQGDGTGRSWQQKAAKQLIYLAAFGFP